MDLLNSKEVILSEINNVFTSYNENIQSHIEKQSEFNLELSRLNQLNKKLLHEISEKDKFLSLNDKKLHDYEVMINKIQEKATKELDANDRGNMIRILDKENNEKDVIIKQLNEKINNLECKLTSLTDTSINLEINDNNDNNDAIVGWSPTSSNHPLNNNDNVEDVNDNVENVNDNVEDVNDNVEDDGGNNGDEESDDGGNNGDEESDDGAVVEIITHYKKEYYIIEGEDPQYIYAIEDGELGDKVGEMKGKKKVFY